MPAPTKASSRTPRAFTLSPRQRLRRRVLLGAILALEVVMLGYAGASVMAAMALMAPNSSPRPITQTPAAWGLLYQTVSFPSRSDHLLIRGWLMPGLLPDGKQTVERTIIVVHGYPGNRSSVLRVSAALVQHGFAVLALDLRGNGESAPAPTSLGEFEQRDILGAVVFLQTHVRPFPLLGRPCAIGVRVPGREHVLVFSLTAAAYVQRMVAFYQSALGRDSR